MKRLVFLAVVLFLVSTQGFAGDLAWEEISDGAINVSAALINPANEQVILIGTDKAVLKTTDAGSSWRPVLLLKGNNSRVNLLIADGDKFFAATGAGLYKSHDNGNSWKRIFKGKNYFENDCNALAIDGQKLYLGTKQGLFLSNDSARTWHKEGGELANSGIFDMADAGSCIYIASSRGVYRFLKDTRVYEKIYYSLASYQTNDIPEEGSTEDPDGIYLMRVAFDNSKKTVYVAGKKGVFQSFDDGKSWDTVPDFGLLDKQIRDLAVIGDSVIYAAARKGVFEFKQDRWQELTGDLEGENFNSICQDKKSRFYVASDKGLFKTNLAHTINSGSSFLNLYYKDEPAIGSLQEAAIKYAEVSPEKIADWRKKAAMKAFLPRFSASIDRDTGDLWHWEGGSSTKAGDDILVRGRDAVGWDVTLTWDLSEIIWNNDQTSIDVRSRLMVELRDDILDAINKYYFERIRIRMEVDNLSIEDRKKRAEKELKLQELAASLDALTGGYYSRYKNNRQENK
ncbi:MAG: hypothetical protein FJZ15_04820 [Candidatus Omnitrophica bacterium]|nr:hypothetical protein [Candidatus Omnitrophota bacterium]